MVMWLKGTGMFIGAFYDSVPVQTERMMHMKKTFSSLFDLDIEGFRTPFYQHNNNTYPAEDNAGLTYDCSKNRFETAFKGIPFVQERYMYTKIYPFTKPAQKFIAAVHNAYCNSPRIPYLITPKVVEFPTLGISDYTLIEDPYGPLFHPEDAKEIGNIWIDGLLSYMQGRGRCNDPSGSSG